MRKTKIVCTVGPACDNEETLQKMLEAGMNVARLNFSHGTHEEQHRRIDLLKSVREKANKPLALMLITLIKNPFSLFKRTDFCLYYLFFIKIYRVEFVLCFKERLEYNRGSECRVFCGDFENQLFPVRYFNAGLR